jgi:hypothetical protein
VRLAARSTGGDHDHGEGLPQPAERAVSGLAETLAALPDDGSTRLLDLGPLVVANFDVYTRHARWIRFAHVWRDALPTPGPGTDPRVDPARAVPYDDRCAPYDVVLAWDVLDCLEPDDAVSMVHRIASVCRPRARLHALFTGTGARPTRPSRYAITAPGRVRPLDDEPRTLPTTGLSPAELERRLAPFAVEHSCVLRHGGREVVAVLR